MKRYWTFDLVAAEAKKYATRTDFVRGAPAAYRAAQRSKWIDSVCQHMKQKLVRWSDDMLTAEAAKYGTRAAFMRGSGSAYATVWKRGMINHVCAHMAKKVRVRGHYIYSITCADSRDVYVGQSVMPRRRYMEHLRLRMGNIADLLVGPHTFTIIAGPMSTSRIAAAEQEAIARMRAEGWNVRNVRRGGELGAMPGRWTIDKLRSAALKHSCRWDFQKYAPNAYAAARRMGVVSEICAHMPIQQRRRYGRPLENSRTATCHGITKRIVDWSAESGVSRKTISDRLKRGWPSELAVFKARRVTRPRECT